MQTSLLYRLPVVAIGILFILPTIARSDTLTVALDGTGQFTCIQDAINAAAHTGDTVVVADGTYSGNGNRDLDFNGKNLTVKSLNGPITTVIDCGGFQSSDGSGNHRGFYVHSGEDQAVISGFTIKNGYEDQDGGGTMTVGGGIDIDNSAATVQNCIVTGNTADLGGGGIYAHNGTITVSDCTISGNTAQQNSGGGVQASDNNGESVITLANCDISGNTAAYAAGILVNNFNSGTITITNCTVFRNAAQEIGGGIAAENDGPAGAITLTNCTIAANTAPHGRGIFAGSYFPNSSSTITATNCIVYDDTVSPGGEEIFIDPNFTVDIHASYDDIQGGYPGASNINADPLFVNANSGDLHLQPGSPCLSAGTPSGAPITDFDGNVRPDPPSMGAHDGLKHNWTAVSIAAGSDGRTRLLWTKSDGTASFWKVNAAGAAAYSPLYGPFTGWTAQKVAAAPNGSTYIFWTTASGAASVWTISQAGFISYSSSYGPFIGWTPIDFNASSDGSSRILWHGATGAASIWRISGGSIAYSPTFGPYNGWNAMHIAAAPGTATRLLWTSASGTASVWSITQNISISYSPTFGPFAGWTCSDIGIGNDGMTKLQWNDGCATSFWTLSSSNTVAFSPVWGPFSGWSPTDFAVAPDNSVRVLWDAACGAASFWGISPGFSTAYSQPYGPF